VLSSAIVQIPMQIALDHAYNKDLIDQLIRSDLYLRVITSLARGLIILYMLQCIVHPKLIADPRN